MTGVNRWIQVIFSAIVIATNGIGIDPSPVPGAQVNIDLVKAGSGRLSFAAVAFLRNGQVISACANPTGPRDIDAEKLEPARFRS